MYDGDIVWGADFCDIVTADEHGGKVIDHDKLDSVKMLKVRGSSHCLRLTEPINCQCRSIVSAEKVNSRSAIY